MVKTLENKMEKMQESINKDLEELMNQHTETNNTTTEIKNTLEGISELEDKMVEIMKRIEDSLRDLWDNIKCTNIQIIGVPEEEEKKKGYENIFEIIVDIFPNMEKEIVNQVQGAQRVSNRINPRRNTPRHILIRLTKAKHKEEY